MYILQVRDASTGKYVRFMSWEFKKFYAGYQPRETILLYPVKEKEKK